VDRLVLGHVGEQPARALLPAHTGWTQADHRADQPLGCAGAGGQQDPPAGGGRRVDRSRSGAASRSREPRLEKEASQRWAGPASFFAGDGTTSGRVSWSRTSRSKRTTTSPAA